MGIYISILVFIIVLQIILKKTKLANIRALFVGIVSLVLILFSALRSVDVGQDTSVYVERFKIISESSWKQLVDLKDVVDFEIGYIIFNKVISIISANEHIFLLIVSSIIIVSTSLYVYRKSDIVWLSLFLFVALGFFGETMNIMRQMIAIAILLPSIKFIEERNIFKFTILVAIASLFHLTAFSFLIIYPMSLIKINKKYYIGIVVSIALLYVYADAIIFWSMKLLGYQDYLVNIGEGSGLGMISMLIFFLVLGLYYRQNLSNSELSDTNIKSYDVYINILVVAIFINTIAIHFALAGRVMVYFTFHNIILLPKIIKTIDNKWQKVIVSGVIILGITYYFVFKLLVDDGSGVVPYLFAR